MPLGCEVPPGSLLPFATKASADDGLGLVQRNDTPKLKLNIASISAH